MGLQVAGWVQGAGREPRSCAGLSGGRLYLPAKLFHLQGKHS